MVPLSQQLYNQPGFACATLYALLLLAPFVLLWRADRNHRWLAIGFALAAVAVRLPYLSVTPPEISPDEDGTLLTLIDWPMWNWHRIFAEGPVNGATGWVDFPWYVAYRLTNSLMAIRVVGLIWSSAVAAYAVTFGARIGGLAGGAVAAAVLSFTPWSLFISRNSFGMEIILQQLYLLAAADGLRERPGWRNAFVCGLMLALLQLTYIVVRISVALPLAWVVLGPWPKLRRSLVFLTLAYALGAICIQPHLATNPLHFWGHGQMADYDSNLHDLAYMMEKARIIFASLAWRDYAVFGTLALKGAQTLSPIILIAASIGALVSLRGYGKQLVAALVIAAIPCWLSPSAGNSHRMMLMLAPIALLAGAAPLAVPIRFRNTAATLLVLAIAVSGLHTWLSDDFWAPFLFPAARWQPSVRDPVEREMNLHPDYKVKVYPISNSLRLLAREHKLTSLGLDLMTSDFASHYQITLVLQRLREPSIEIFERAAAADVVEVERISEILTLLRFPHGMQALLGDPPSLGWQFSVVCPERPDQNQKFVTPLLLEDFTAPETRPCRFRWHAQARERLENLTLYNEGIKSGTIHIGSTVLPFEPLLHLPTVEAGDEISIELEGAGRRIMATLLRDDGDFVTWEAVRPLP